mmetsp:Transcript_34617/g.55707  ORF Transcript_34617/g.55707 Transcript_34617/m.55707 type:complete len:154 (-) Transcript_34617:347-808(-)
MTANLFSRFTVRNAKWYAKVDDKANMPAKKCFTASSFSVTGASGLHIGGASENMDEVNIKISMTTMTKVKAEIAAISVELRWSGLAMQSSFPSTFAISRFQAERMAPVYIDRRTGVTKAAQIQTPLNSAAWEFATFIASPLAVNNVYKAHLTK